MRRNPRDCRTRGVFRRMSGLWQRRRERVQLRRAISRFCKLNDHLLRDIGLNRLVLSYAFCRVQPNGRGYPASRNGAARRSDRVRAIPSAQLRRTAMTVSSEFPLGLQQQPARGAPTPAGNDRTRPRARMNRHLGRRAVVIGAGIGGLAAAGALAKYFERVDILERDGLASIGRIAVGHAAGSAPAWPARRRPSRARSDFPRFRGRSRRSRRCPGHVRARCPV